MCPSPPGIPVGSAVSDPDGDGDGIYGEADQFDQDCNLYGLTALSTVTKRGLDELTLDDLRAWYNAQEEQLIISHGGEDLNLGFHWEAKFDPFDVGNHSVAARDARLLEKRTFDNGAVLKFCAAGAPQANIYPQTYSGYRTIAKLANKGWVAIAKPAICGAIGVASFATKPANTEFVTEHVFEKQSLRDYLEYMTLGQLPGGGVLAAGKTTVTGIFDAGGIFFTSWPAGMTSTWGTSPVATAFGALGHAEAPANYDNLQVCDRDINAVKALITAAKAFIDPKEFAKLGPLQQTAFLADVIDTFSYMKFRQTVSSYNAAYKALVSFWGVFAAHPSAQAGYDYVGGFKDLVSADLDIQVSTALKQFKTLAAVAQKTWAASTVTGLDSGTIVTENRNAIADFVKNAATYISYDKLNTLK